MIKGPGEDPGFCVAILGASCVVFRRFAWMRSQPIRFAQANRDKGGRYFASLRFTGSYTLA